MDGTDVMVEAPIQMDEWDQGFGQNAQKLCARAWHQVWVEKNQLAYTVRTIGLCFTLYVQTIVQSWCNLQINIINYEIEEGTKADTHGALSTSSWYPLSQSTSTQIR